VIGSRFKGYKMLISGMAPPSWSLDPKPRITGDLTDAPLEDEVLHDDASGEDSDADNN